MFVLVAIIPVILEMPYTEEVTALVTNNGLGSRKVGKRHNIDITYTYNNIEYNSKVTVKGNYREGEMVIVNINPDNPEKAIDKSSDNVTGFLFFFGLGMLIIIACITGKVKVTERNLSNENKV